MRPAKPPKPRKPEPARSVAQAAAQGLALVSPQKPQPFRPRPKNPPK